MEKLDSIFKALPIVLLLYGIVQSIGEIFEVSLSSSALRTETDTEWQLRMMLYVSYIRALDAMFFYLALAAVVHWLNVRSRGTVA
ncbi:hypothetical protein [uncultured Ruegeria sp.]|uniref:hypothetical protein n=1 Tax=uncultured Ruegeria sp. TaxID=259304 RepID=UPI0026256BDB|nr:hypothetical protein [uncultured Ruegeria sp.]